MSLSQTLARNSVKNKNCRCWVADAMQIGFSIKEPFQSNRSAHGTCGSKWESRAPVQQLTSFRAAVSLLKIPPVDLRGVSQLVHNSREKLGKERNSFRSSGTFALKVHQTCKGFLSHRVQYVFPVHVGTWELHSTSFAQLKDQTDVPLRATFAHKSQVTPSE